MIRFTKSTVVSLLIVNLTFPLEGCSIYQATHAPAPVEYKQVIVGSTRTETIARLGYPKMTDQKNNLKTDSFDFLDGYNTASKARIILYLAGDIFTIGLAELIFWPIEANVFDGKQCRALLHMTQMT